METITSKKAKVTLHKCDYCGGWEAKNEGFADTVVNLQVTYYDDNIMRVSRSICLKCFVKVFDIVLGEPKFISKCAKVS